MDSQNKLRSTPSAPKDYLRGLGELAYLFPFYLFFLCLVITLVVAVNEISSRQTLLQLIDTLQKEAIAAENHELRGGLARTVLKENPSKLTPELLSSLRNALLTLSAIGAPYGSGILNDDIMAELHLSSKPSSAIPFIVEKDEHGRFWALLLQYSPIPQMRTDNLLAAGMICAGIVGAFSAAFRKRKLNPKVDETSGTSVVEMTIEAVIIGTGAALLCFLAVKGGRHAFFLEFSGAIAMVNPYSGTFSAFVAGLFTEKLFGLLSELVDAATERIKGATQPNPGKTGTVSKDNTETPTTPSNPSQNGEPPRSPGKSEVVEKASVVSSTFASP
jgi:hypothetical protein